MKLPLWLGNIKSSHVVTVLKLFVLKVFYIGKMLNTDY